MDKASLLGDAITYINELQSKLQEAEFRVKELQCRASEICEKPADSGFPTAREQSGNSTKEGLSAKPQGSSNSTSVMGTYFTKRTPDINVHILGDEAMIRVNCLRDTCSITNLMMSLQDLHLEVQHSNTSAIEDALLHIIIVRVSLQCYVFFQTKNSLSCSNKQINAFGVLSFLCTVKIAKPVLVLSES
jgi:transcription factor MYC2